jgi:hypothetical protein
VNELARKIDFATRWLVNDLLEWRGDERLDEDEFLPYYNDYRVHIQKRGGFFRGGQAVDIILAGINYAFDQDLQTGTQVLFALKARYQEIYPEAFKNYEQDR